GAGARPAHPISGHRRAEIPQCGDLLAERDVLWPLAARAQKPTRSIVSFLNPDREGFAHLTAPPVPNSPAPLWRPAAHSATTSAPCRGVGPPGARNSVSRREWRVRRWNKRPLFLAPCRPQPLLPPHIPRALAPR